MRAAAIFFLARVILAAIAGSLTRNARATSAVERPHNSLSVNATRASGAIAGWQQVKIRRRRSSAISCRATSCGGSPSGSTGSSTSSGSDRRSVAPRRSRSSARRLAAVVSQAPGFAGTPRDAQAVRALAYASCTHSSARSRSRVTRTAAASTRAHSRRCASATAAAAAAAAGSAAAVPAISRAPSPGAPRRRRTAPGPAWPRRRPRRGRRPR